MIKLISVRMRSVSAILTLSGIVNLTLYCLEVENMKACWVCVRVLAWFCCITAGARLCEAKVIQGAVSSLQAWEEKGQFVAKFCFHGETLY